jgi:hypothetical protein
VLRIGKGATLRKEGDLSRIARVCKERKKYRYLRYVSSHQDYCNYSKIELIQYLNQFGGSGIITPDLGFQQQQQQQKRGKKLVVLPFW